jgi:DNA processing protein
MLDVGPLIVIRSGDRLLVFCLQCTLLDATHLNLIQELELMDMTEHEAYIALNMMEKIGPVSVRSLVAVLGSATAIFDASEDDLCRAGGIGRGLAASIIRQRDGITVERELERAAETGTHIITPQDEEYPAALRDIHDPPLALYVRGRLMPTDRHAVAVVGTRRASRYGMDTARKLSYQLAEAGICVLSGLALGVDTAAHEGAIRGGGRTVAVIGSGFDHIYPEENIALAERIAGHGAVLTEFPFSRKPDKTTFPMRNRIVSGMSAGVLVVEAGARSGAAITAAQALVQGRSVFAVPGRIDSHLSVGTNALIKDGAYPVTCIRDILEHFEMLFPQSFQEDSINSEAKINQPNLSEDEIKIVKLLAQGEVGADLLIRESGINTAKVSSLLVALELKKVVRMLPGRKVELIG